MHCINIGSFSIGKGHPLVVICGPCVIESEAHSLSAAAHLKEIFGSLGIHFIFKSSYDKANRSSHHSFRGPGLQEGLRILAKIKQEFNVPILTDVHSEEQAIAAAEVCDIIQIPAFLCRQTDLLVTAAQTGCVINVKKGQFMAPWDMKNVVDKIHSAGNKKVFLTDRGVSFGYNNLVSDMRAIPIMQSFGVPVCFDATHSVQLPGGQGTSSGGQREFIPILAQAAVAVNVDCLYMEAHDCPAQAKSDSSSVLDFKDLPALLKTLQAIHRAVRK